MPRNRSLPRGAALTVELLSAYVSNNTVAAQELPDLIRTTRSALMEATSPIIEAGDGAATTPAVSVRNSLASSSHILSMIDGKPYRTLRRHLAAHGLTPEDYRERYKLSADYPMVAPDYTVFRRAVARRIGLGKKASAQERQGGAPAAVVATSTMQPVTGMNLASAEDGASRSDKKGPGLKVRKHGAGRKRGSPAATPASVSAAHSEDPTRQSASTRSQEKATGIVADAAQLAEGKSSGAVMPRRREKLSLFATRTGENQNRSRKPYAVTAAADSRPSTELDGPSWSIATALSEQAHLGLADRASEPSQQNEDVCSGTSTRLTLMEAIAQKRAVMTLYNSTVIKLAPHQLFERRGDLYLIALNLTKNWRSDEERRLGQFKLAGLRDAKLLDDIVVPLGSYNGMPPRPEDVSILSI